MTVQPTVFVIDDDESARKSICAIVQSIGLNAESFASAEVFLDKYVEGRNGCLITDLRMPGMSGVELQEQLIQRKIFLPLIVLTAYARTPTTVRAIKAGAITVLDKPYVDDDLLDAVRAALAIDADERIERLHRQEIRANLAKLTTMERKVLDMIVKGLPNKTIANELNVSLRTIENRRQEIYAKIQVNSTAELIRLVVEAESGYLH
jgi:two-component system, LuxR family, response regulator FixJ